MTVRWRGIFAVHSWIITTGPKRRSRKTRRYFTGEQRQVRRIRDAVCRARHSRRLAHRQTRAEFLLVPRSDLRQIIVLFRPVGKPFCELVIVRQSRPISSLRFFTWA